MSLKDFLDKLNFIEPVIKRVEAQRKEGIMFFLIIFSILILVDVFIWGNSPNMAKLTWFQAIYYFGWLFCVLCLGSKIVNKKLDEKEKIRKQEDEAKITELEKVQKEQEQEKIRKKLCEIIDKLSVDEKFILKNFVKNDCTSFTISQDCTNEVRCLNNKGFKIASNHEHCIGYTYSLLKFDLLDILKEYFESKKPKNKSKSK